MSHSAGTHAAYGLRSDEGELHAWGGIVSARLQSWADALNATPDAVMQAAEENAIDPVTDTAQPKGQGKDRDRPTAPQLRSLAFTREDANRLMEAVGGDGAKV